MKKSSRDRRAFRRLQRRSMPCKIMTQKLIDLIVDKADSARFAGLSLREMQEVVRKLC